MHRTLEIHEILLNIFGHCYSPDAYGDSYPPEWIPDLAALARTCRAFKEPALDLLWEELEDLTPLAVCLSVEAPPSSEETCFVDYAFPETLTQAEWDTLQNYTRRIWSISLFEFVGLTRKSVETLSRPPFAEPLFQNLRHLRFHYTLDARPLLLLPLPSLICLGVCLGTLDSLHSSLETFAELSPNLKTLFIDPDPFASADLANFYPDFVHRWRDLQAVLCSQVFLDINTLVHLYRMPALTCFDFMLSGTMPRQIAPPESPLTFTRLCQFGLQSRSLASIWRMFSQIRLPAVTRFYVVIKRCPLRRDLAFLANFRSFGVSHVIQDLKLDQRRVAGRSYVPAESRPILGSGDLHSCVVFDNLRVIDLNIEWKVNLADNELLTLASAWPHLQCLSINREWGWNTLGGITPDGVLRLLQTCRSLCNITLAIDTRGYTICRSPAVAEPKLYIDVVDSFIEVESVPAIAAFIAGIVSSRKHSLCAWGGQGMDKSSHRDACKERWSDVERRVADAMGQHSS